MSNNVKVRLFIQLNYIHEQAVNKEEIGEKKAKNNTIVLKNNKNKNLAC